MFKRIKLWFLGKMWILGKRLQWWADEAIIEFYYVDCDADCDCDFDDCGDCQ
jgi:hypothetical protein